MNHILFEGCENFKDAGGYPADNQRVVRQGMVYRSGRLSALTDSDLSRFQSLGIRTVIDLRSADEIEEHPDRLPEEGRCKTVHIPLNDKNLGKKQVVDVFRKAVRGEIDTHKQMEKDYEQFPFELAEGVKPVFEQLSDQHAYPVLIHCTAGKDRTGFVSFLLLGALGCSEKTLIEDYLNYQRKDLNALARKYAATFAQYDLTVPLELTYPYLVAHKDYIQSLAGSIRRNWGSAADYLEKQVGFTKDKQNQLKQILLV